MDEATLLVGAEALTKSFETIYDRKLDALAVEHRMNLFFVFAGTTDVLELRNERSYGGFSRRFMGPETNPHPVVKLRLPHVGREDQEDDLTWAIAKVRDLSLGSGFRQLPTTHKEASDLRAEIADVLEQGQLSWHGLWSAVCEKHVRPE